MRLTFIYLFFISTVTYAQQIERYYYSKADEWLNSKDSANYYRDFVLQGDTIFRCTRYNLMGIRQEEGYTKKSGFLNYQGNYKTFYPNQVTESEGTYDEGSRIGIWRYFYKKGSLKEQRQYELLRNRRKDWSHEKYRLDVYQDSTGNVLVKEGNGTYVLYHPNGNVAEKGNYVNGEKAGNWLGNYLNGQHWYEENYKNGVLSKGVSYDSLGRNYVYTQLKQNAEFAGGDQAFYSFLNKNMRYPVEAQRPKIQGRVFMSFAIEANGNISNIKVLKSPNHLLSAEAIRVIGEMNGKWTPGKLRGQFEKTTYNIPLTFSLG